jgi:hypothetical protein
MTSRDQVEETGEVDFLTPLDTSRGILTREITRCIQLNLPPKAAASASSSIPTPSDTETYIEFVNTLKDLILISFDSIAKEREDAVKRGEAARALPGWAWGSWFLSKVSAIG